VSSIALIWAANVKGLKPAAKVVLIQLADFHNKDTGLCFPSAHRLAAECEMGRATLFRHMTTLEECGLITRHARGDGEGGRGSNQYELHLDITLGPSAHPTGGSCGSIRVVSQNETGGNVSKKRGKPMPPTAQVTPGLRSVFPITGSSRGVGRPMLRSKSKTERRRRLWRPITMRGWPAGSVTAARCASTSRPRKSRHCLPQSW